MKRLIFIFLLNGILFTCAQAQNSGFVPGYIVTLSNDTLAGEVKFAETVTFTRTLTDVRFREEKGGHVKIYPPGGLIGFAGGTKVFHSFTIPQFGKQYLELVLDGRVRLYRFTRPIAFVGSPAQVDEFLLRQGDTDLFAVKSIKFKKRASAYFSSNAVISDKIKSGTYQRYQIERIVREYNATFPKG
jgi:hypothetical protein